MSDMAIAFFGGIAVGIVVLFLFLVTLPRDED